MGQQVTQVDAFTSERYRGNPAAICILDHEADPEWMQQVANEMNLSETAYVVPREDGFGLRWFTPATEVDLCGHATVAAAHVLWEEGVVAADVACRFQTRSGLLTAAQSGDGWINVSFPREAVQPCEIPDGADRALGVEVVAAGECTRLSYLVLEVSSEDSVNSAAPDYSLVAELEQGGIIVTSRARSDAGYQVVSRFFAPRMGINEDPATGSAHCVLSTYWAERLGRSSFNAYQASPRGAHIRVLLGDAQVTLGGQAVTVFRGELV